MTSHGTPATKGPCTIEQRLDGKNVFCLTHERSAMDCFVAKDAEISRLREELREYVRIWHHVADIKRPNGDPLSPFFFGQMLRRMVREHVPRAESALIASGSKEGT